MNNKTTWIIITDGYFIKIMVKSASGSELRTFRDNDFEQTSNITYKLVTHKRNIKDTSDQMQYFIRLLSDFLQESFENKTYEQLILISPDNVTEELKQHLPETIKSRIVATISDDYLHVTQDKIEKYLMDIPGV